MFNNEIYNRTRREAEITSAEFADFTGISRRSAFQMELCREPAGEWAMKALSAMIAARVAS